MKNELILILGMIILFSGIGFAVPMDVALLQDGVATDTYLCGDDTTIGINGNITSMNQTNNPLLTYLSLYTIDGATQTIRWTTGNIWDLRFNFTVGGESTFNKTMIKNNLVPTAVIIPAADFDMTLADDNKWANVTNATAYDNDAMYCNKNEDCGSTNVQFIDGTGLNIVPTGTYRVYVRGICHNSTGGESSFNYSVSLDGLTEIPCSADSGGNKTYAWWYAGSKTFTSGTGMGVIFLGGEGYESIVDAMMLVDPDYYAGIGNANWLSKDFTFTTGTSKTYTNILYGYDSANKTGTSFDVNTLTVYADTHDNYLNGRCAAPQCQSNTKTSIAMLQMVFVILGIIVALYFIANGSWELAIGAAVVFFIFVIMASIVLPILGSICA